MAASASLSGPMGRATSVPPHIMPVGCSSLGQQHGDGDNVGDRRARVWVRLPGICAAHHARGVLGLGQQHGDGERTYGLKNGKGL